MIQEIQGGIFGFVLALIASVFPIYQYFINKRLEQKDIRFKTYHRLIDELIGEQMLDRQIAIVFELFNFKDYHPVTLRILEGLKIHWSDSKNPTKNKRLIDEIDYTIKEIERYHSYRCIFRCFFRRRLKPPTENGSLEKGNAKN